MNLATSTLYGAIITLFLPFLVAWELGDTHIDPETSIGVLTTRRRKDGRKLALRFSDEFNQEGRGFGPGEDPWFEAVEKPDESNQSIEFYNSSREYVTTKEGALSISTRAVKTEFKMWVDDREYNGSKTFVKNYTSGMIQSWNKFCFTGGVLEMRIQLPGHADSGGIWPAAWLMGNLARGTWMDSTKFQWPWSYNRCRADAVIEGLDPFGKQEINACDPNPGYGMHPYQGRGAPEIDIFEVMPGHEMPEKGDVKAFMSTSLQISPGISKQLRPSNGKPLVDPKTGIRSNKTWYEGIEHTPRGAFNDGFWGQECGPEVDQTPDSIHKYMEDAISVNSDLESTHFEEHHTYRLEWQPGNSGDPSNPGYLQWWLDDEFILGIEGTSLQDLTGSEIPFEPMYLILNTAISHRWGMPEPCPKDTCGACWECYDCMNPECQCALPKGMRGCRNLPAVMSIDWIRLYQDEHDESHTFGCSPPAYPTAEFIAAHPERYAPWTPYQGPDVVWYPGYVQDVVTTSLSHFVNVIRVNFGILLFPMVLLWIGVGIYLAIKYCHMREELDLIGEKMRSRLNSINSQQWQSTHSALGSLGISTHSHDSSDGRPSPERVSIEMARKRENERFWGENMPDNGYESIADTGVSLVEGPYDARTSERTLLVRQDAPKGYS